MYYGPDLPVLDLGLRNAKHGLLDGLASRKERLPIGEVLCLRFLGKLYGNFHFNYTVNDLFDVAEATSDRLTIESVFLA